MSRYKFFHDFTVPVYDADLFGRLSISSLLSYIQYVSGGHLSSLGLGYERLLDEGFVFVVAGTALKIYRCPLIDEEITLSTAPRRGRGAHMLRETVVHSKDGELLAQAQVTWALIEPKSGRLLRQSDFPYTLPELEGEWTPFFDPTKIRIHPAEQKHGKRVVRLSDLDQNRHMNNTIYADILLDCFAGEYLNSGGVDTLFIRYHRQARLGDELTLVYGCEGEKYSLGATVGEHPCFEGAFSLKPLAIGCSQ